MVPTGAALAVRGEINMYEDTLWEEQHAMMQELDVDSQHCHNCVYWSNPYETEKEPNDSGDCCNPWDKKIYGKRPKGRWCPSWSRTYDFPEDHITNEDKKRARKI